MLQGPPRAAANKRNQRTEGVEDPRYTRQERFRRHGRIVRLDLNKPPRCFKIHKEIYDAIEARDIRLLKNNINFEDTIDEQNYYNPLKLLLSIEEAHHAVEMRRHDLLDFKIKVLGGEDPRKPHKKKHYAIYLRGQDENTILDKTDIILIEDIRGGPIRRYPIASFIGDLVVLPPGVDEKLMAQRLNIYFIPSGLPFEICAGALDDFEKGIVSDKQIFESKEASLDGPLLDIANSTASWSLKSSRADVLLLQLNPEQRQAVVGILRAECRPKPYILFGPPGTGKTQTLVQAVVQIYLRSPRARVLFCANSNTCADQIYEKLEATQVFPRSRFDCPLIRLRPGNWVGKERIVVTTNIKSAGLKTGKLFDYVFIDESGHAHEVESLVPCCSLKRRDSCLVLAGDPKQLGPIVQCDEAAKNGLDRSMLDRLMEWDVYQRQGEGNEYNSKYITKLLECYRCDPRVLAVSNKLFYGGELKCLNETPRSLMRIMGLRSPVQVRFCAGEEIQPYKSTSWENSGEVHECVNIVIRLYKMGFTPDQIGIISAYKRQVKEMRWWLKKILRDKGISDTLDCRFPMKVQKGCNVNVRQRSNEEDNMDSIGKRFDRMHCSDSDCSDNSSSSSPCEDANDQSSAKGDSQDLTKDAKRAQEEEEEEEEWVRAKSDWCCKIDTVDSFQGNEREVIIISTVRTNPDNPLGFLNDARRFNVAISRAKWLLIVVGDKRVLEMSENWRELLDNARDDIKNWPKQSRPFEAHNLSEALFRR